MKKLGYILGRRIKGDIILDTDPITNAPGRILGPAVRLTGNEQFYDEQSVVQNFTLGSRMVVDERTFHYARAGLAIINTGTFYLAVTTDQILQNSDRLTRAPAAIVGDTTVIIDVTAAGCPWGALAFQGGVVALNELVGGYVEIWPVAGGNQFMWRRIIANTAAVAGLVTITVDRPFNFAIGLLSGVTIHPSIYRSTVSAFDAGLADHAVAVGLPPIPVTNGWFYWLQTWGHCCIGPTGLGVWPLAAAAAGPFVDLYFSINEGGSRSSLLANVLAGGAIATVESPQRIGYALGAGNWGSGEAMLQLAP